MRLRFRVCILCVAVIASLAPSWRPHAASDAGGTVDLLLLLAVDVSDSITPEKAHLQREGYVRAIADPAVITAIRQGRRGSIAVSYLEWASPDEQFQIVGWRRIADTASARDFADALRHAPYEYGYWTSISAAIDRSVSVIEAAPFAAPRRVIDLSSDGRNNRGRPVLAARARALSRGIAINGLLVLASRRNFTLPPQPHLDRYFDACVIGGPGAFTEIAEGTDDFVRAVRRKLVREIAGLPTGLPGVILAADSPASPAFCD